MKWRSFGTPAHNLLNFGVSWDRLDIAAWRGLRAAIIAASMGDARTHADIFRRWPGEAADEGRRASLYLWYLLRYRIADVLGRRPAAEDLRELAKRIYPRFAKLIRQDASRLEATFRTVFESNSAEDHLKGGMFLIMGTAALGALLDDDAEAELAAMRPHLADWWQRRGGEFRAIGVK